MATVPANRVKVNTLTTGNGASITLGGATSTLFMTPVEAGLTNGITYQYVIEQGGDFEINSGLYNSGVIARGTPSQSKIGGVAGTSKLNLTGMATVSFPTFKETFGGAAILNVGITTGTVAAGDDSRFTASPGNWKVTYSDGSGVVQPLALGASGTVLAGGGVAAAPTFSSIATVLGFTPIATSANLVEVSSPGNWKVFYTNGSGVITELTTGAAGTILSGNGVTAAPGWKALSLVTQVFTGGGTYTPTTGMIYALVTAVGSGGGGGAAVGTVAQLYVGGGGGGGSTSQKTLSAATIGGSQTVTIGSFGTGGTAGTNNGGNGGDCSLGALVIGKGGTGGKYGAQPQIGTGGAGGVAGTGDVTGVGAPGSAGFYNSVNTGIVISGGKGGGGWMGTGGAPEIATGAGTTTGAAASNYGGGGGGGSANNTASNAAGGNGSTGIVIVVELVAV